MDKPNNLVDITLLSSIDWPEEFKAQIVLASEEFNKKQELKNLEALKKVNKVYFTFEDLVRLGPAILKSNKIAIIKLIREIAAKSPENISLTLHEAKVLSELILGERE